MNTSQTSSFLTEVVDDKKPIPEAKLAYFSERLKNRMYDFIVSEFFKKEKSNLLTRADLARRTNKSREQITRWLSSPGNWELDTISALTLAIFKGELNFKIDAFSETPTRRNSSPLALLQDAITASENGYEFNLGNASNIRLKSSTDTSSAVTSVKVLSDAHA